MTNTVGKYIIAVLLLTSISYTASAQRRRRIYGEPGRVIVVPPPPPSNYVRPNVQPYNQVQQQPLTRIQVIKEQYISKQLALSPEQTYQFLATYRRYQQETIAVRQLKRFNNSDAQANGSDQVNKDLEYETELVNIRKRYTQEFLRIMPAEKVSLIFKSERQFNDEALRIYKGHRGNANGPAPVPNN